MYLQNAKTSYPLTQEGTWDVFSPDGIFLGVHYEGRFVDVVLCAVGLSLFYNKGGKSGSVRAHYVLSNERTVALPEVEGLEAIKG